MKRVIGLTLILALCAVTLCACGRGGEEASETPSPEPTSAINFSPNGAPGYVITDGSSFSGASDMAEQPTLEPVQTYSPQERAALQAAIAAENGAASEAGANAAAASPTPQPQAVPLTGGVNAYQYAAVMDDNIDYTFNYPTQWQHVPGVYTVCYREIVEQGDFPARVAVTRKRLVHTPNENAILDQLSSYMKSMAKQYDKSTFQVNTPNRDATFMGKKAYSNTYLAYWGDEEVVGYVIGTAIDRTLYVLHFTAKYQDYVAMDSLRQYIVNSVRLKEKS